MPLYGRHSSEFANMLSLSHRCTLKKVKIKRRNKKPLWDQFNTTEKKKTTSKFVHEFNLHRAGILPSITIKMRSGPLKYSKWSAFLVCKSCSALDRHRFIKIWPMPKENWALEGTESRDRGTWTEQGPRKWSAKDQSLITLTGMMTNTGCLLTWHLTQAKAISSSHKH